MIECPLCSISILTQTASSWSATATSVSHSPSASNVSTQCANQICIKIMCDSPRWSTQCILNAISDSSRRVWRTVSWLTL